MPHAMDAVRTHARRWHPPSRIAVALAAAFVALAFVPAASANAAGHRATPPSWLTYGDDLQRTGYNPDETTIGPGNARRLHEAWSADLGDVMIAQAVQGSGVNVQGAVRTLIYEGTEHGDFYALRSSDGVVVWHVNLGSIQTSCFDMPDAVFGIGGAGTIHFTGLDKGVIYVAGGDGSVHALDLATGAEQAGWPVTGVFTPAQDHVYSGLNLLRGKLYVTVASHCDDAPYFGKTVEIDTATHSIVRRFYPAGAPSHGISGGGIWGPGGASIDPTNGHVFVATGNALTTPERFRYSEDVVELSRSLQVLGSNYPGLIGGDVDFGATPILYRPAGCPTTQVAAKNKSGVLVVYDEGNVSTGYTQRVQVGSVADWQFNGIPAWDPVTNMLYIGNSSDSSSDVYLHGMVALKAGSDCTLSLAWQRSVGPNFASVSPPIVANGVVYYGDGYENTEYAFDAATGAPLWNSGSVIGGALYAAPTVIGGQLLVPAWDGKLYAFRP
jgi:outer membrane protein assembly factor BamB